MIPDKYYEWNEIIFSKKMIKLNTDQIKCPILIYLLMEQNKENEEKYLILIEKGKEIIKNIIEKEEKKEEYKRLLNVKDDKIIIFIKLLNIYLEFETSKILIEKGNDWNGGYLLFNVYKELEEKRKEKLEGENLYLLKYLYYKFYYFTYFLENTFILNLFYFYNGFEKDYQITLYLLFDIYEHSKFFKRVTSSILLNIYLTEPLLGLTLDKIKPLIEYSKDNYYEYLYLKKSKKEYQINKDSFEYGLELFSISNYKDSIPILEKNDFLFKELLLSHSYQMIGDRKKSISILKNLNNEWSKNALKDLQNKKLSIDLYLLSLEYLYFIDYLKYLDSKIIKLYLKHLLQMDDYKNPFQFHFLKNLLLKYLGHDRNNQFKELTEKESEYQMLSFIELNQYHFDYKYQNHPLFSKKILFFLNKLNGLQQKKIIKLVFY